MTVAVREAPPFAFKDETGQWVGITIELWESVAKRLGYKSEYQEYNLADSLDAVANGKADVGVGAFAVTADRVERMYFTHTYASAGLGIATTEEKAELWEVFFDRLVTVNFWRAVAVLAGVLLVAGALVWLFERRQNSDQFSRHPVHGLASGFWWSAVTMTTVGYGDKAPTTIGGRIVALIWMFASIVIISGLTGAIAASLTVSQIVPTVRGPQDLGKVAVGTVSESTGDAYLKSMGVHAENYPSVEEGLAALDQGTIGAFVGDHPILTYWVAKRFAGRVSVLPGTFSPSFLALPMAPISVLHRDVDLALLEFMETSAWTAILTKYNAVR